MKRGLIILYVLMTLLSGCSSSTSLLKTTNSLQVAPYGQFAIDKVSYVSEYKVFQTLDKHFGLAVETNGDGMVIALRTSDDYDPIYDGLRFSGAYVMVETYTYETVPDEKGRTRVKTVPVVIPKDDYLKQKQSGE